MWPESDEQPRPLRTGYTTGCCATACVVAAARWLLNAERCVSVDVELPRGQQARLEISEHRPLSEQAVRTATVKDAGDDPDVTHGATVFVELSLTATPGVVFRAASGVGMVTKEGLSLMVGEPAINPVPRKMITEHLQRYAYLYQYQGGFEVAVGVENGAEIALKTMNPRLGIKGGLSILGTTGIVRPYSCAAYIASIRQGIDVASQNGQQHIAASTGSSSETAIRDHYGLSEMALIEMGDFAGALLKHLKKGQVQKLSLCGGFGKISKLANGHLDLHSGKSSIDLNHLAEQAAALGADAELIDQMQQANTSIAALALCQQQGIALADRICELARQVAQDIVAKEVAVEVWAVNRQGEFVGYAPAEESADG